MPLGWWRRRDPKPPADRAPALERSLVRQAEDAVRREWSLRFEDGVRLALADLADELAAARESTRQTAATPDGGRQSQTLHLAAMRDAIDRIAQEQPDPAIAQACELFDRLVGSAAPVALRYEAAQLALDTLTFLVIADAVERRAKAAAALAQLERLAQRALAA